MSNSQRREEKKRRREKRLAERVRSERSLDNLLHTLQHLGSFSEPRSWPGVADPSLSRPDRIKFELATFAEKGRGHDLCRQLERRLHQGLLHFIPEIEHWGMEEFFWHGLPGNPWHPIDQFLEAEGDRFPAAAQAARVLEKRRTSAATKSVRLPTTWFLCARWTFSPVAPRVPGSAPSPSISAA